MANKCKLICRLHAEQSIPDRLDERDVAEYASEAHALIESCLEGVPGSPRWNALRAALGILEGAHARDRKARRARFQVGLRAFDVYESEEVIARWESDQAEELAHILLSRLVPSGIATSGSVDGNTAVPPWRVQRREMTYQVDARLTVVHVLNTWVVTATEDAVRSGDKVAIYYSDRGPGVLAFEPIFGCDLEDTWTSEDGGLCGRFAFPAPLAKGASHCFTYLTRVTTDEPMASILLTEPESVEAFNTIRAYFPPGVLDGIPIGIVDGVISSVSQKLQVSDLKDTTSVSPLGFVEWTFENCQPGLKYGLKWVWPDRVGIA